MIAPTAGAVQGGALITKTAHDNIHVLVTLTSMHASFGMETVNQWVMSDIARQEAGTPDTLKYLTDSMGLLMTIAQRQKDFGVFCEMEIGSGKDSLNRLEETISALKGFGSLNPEHAENLEKGAKLMRIHGAQLEALSNLHAENTFSVSQVIDRLEERIHAVLHSGCPTGKALRH